ncbi:MAG: type II and III secretion system protein family protein [Alcaligenaceae bacterium]|nr:type II and III secretion system protein family protein [Alcaligenaceae bacterium]
MTVRIPGWRAPAAVSLAVAACLAAPAVQALSVGEGELLRFDGVAKTVFVADPEIADIQVPADDAVLVLGKKTGRTTLYVLDAEGATLLQRQITVRHNVTEITQMLRQRFPGLRLSLESSPGSLMLAGAVPNAETSEAIARSVQSYLGKDEELINRLALNTPTQVYLRVRVTEVSRAVTQQLGINWSGLATSGNFFAGVISGNGVGGLVNTYSNTAAGITGAATGVFGVNRNITNNGYSFLGGYSKSGRSIQAMLDVLDEEGMISILAEPNLTAVSGETASFLAGGEFPIPVKQDEDSMTVEFKPFGVALDFTPTVLSDDRISIKVRPEISELDPNNSIVMEGLVIPGLTVRRVETTVEMASGQSFAIGGLLQNNIRDISSQIPGLGRIPVLGKLFSSSDYQNNKSELVVIVTPYLVKPGDSTSLTTPLDSLRPNTDIEYILHDKIGLDPLKGEVPRLTGWAGFVY